MDDRHAGVHRTWTHPCKKLKRLMTRGTIKFVDLCAGLGGFHRGLSTAAETAARRFGSDIHFECVAAAELESDLRYAYVSNFPEIAARFSELHHNPSSKAVVSNEHTLYEALPTFDEMGTLLQIHGDMTVFLNDTQTGLRMRQDGRPLLPAHDLLCAGFPCQPFSKSGAQLGFEDTRGTVFHSIATILREQRPAFLFLENVGNFPKHDDGNTWLRVKKILEDELDYQIVATNHVDQGSAGGLISPHHLGYPHHRERFFIVGQRRKCRNDDSELVKGLLGKALKHGSVFPSVRKNGALSAAASRILDQKAKKSLIEIISKVKLPGEEAALIASQISPDRVRCINHWGLLLNKLNELDVQRKSSFWRDSMPSFPIWGFELDPWQWYPIEENPGSFILDHRFLSSRRKGLFKLARKQVSASTGAIVDLMEYPPNGSRAGLAKYATAKRISDWIETWPGYAGKRSEWPKWKQRFIIQNRQWAISLWSAIDPAWLRNWLDALYDDIRAPSLQKLEWNCKGEDLDIWKHILQFRPSGLRVKRLAHVPALVAMTTTQAPIVPRMNADEPTTGAHPGARGRHIVSSEALELQGFPSNWILPAGRERAFTCFGNAIHVGVVRDVVLNWLFGQSENSELALIGMPDLTASPQLGATEEIKKLGAA